MSEEDVLKVKALLMDFLTLQMTQSGTSEIEISQNLIIFSEVFDKYWSVLNQTLGIVTDMLDGLTEEKIQTILDYVPVIIAEDSSLEVRVIAAATVVDALFGDGTFDIQALVDTYVMVYFDVKYQMDYSLTILEYTQINFAIYISMLLEDASLIKDFDPNALTPEQIKIVYEAKNIVQYLMGCFQDPESISEFASFDYNHEDFVNLIIQFSGNSMSESEIENLIEMMTFVFEQSEEDTFYLVLSYSSMLQSAQSVTTISDVQSFVVTLLNYGLTKAEISHYVVNFALYMASQAITSIDSVAYEIQNLKDEGDSLQTQYENLLNDSNDIYSSISLAIESISDPVVKQFAYSIFDQRMLAAEKLNSFQILLGQYQDFYWIDGQLLDDILLAYYGDPMNSILPDMDAYYQLTSHMDYEQYSIYMDLCYSYGPYFYEINYYYQLITELDGYGLFTLNMDPMAEYLDIVMADLAGVNIDIDNLFTMLNNLSQDISNLEQQLYMLQVLETLLGNEDVPALLEAAITMLLDEADYFAANANPDTINFIIDLVNGNIQPGYNLTTAELVAGLHDIGVLINVLTVNLDEEDSLVIHSLINIGIEAYFNNVEGNEAFTDSLITIVDTYLDDALGFVPMISTYLINLTEDRVQTLMDQIAILQNVGNAEDDLSNFIRAIAIANIIDVITEDPTLNSDQIIAVVFGAIFDVQTALGYPNDPTTAQRVLEIQTVVNTFISTGLAIVDYNPNSLSFGEILQVNAFKLALENMVSTLGSYMGGSGSPS